MEDGYIGVGMNIPINDEISWTAVPFTDYISDMNLSGEELSRQVAIDVPRMRVTIQIGEGEPVIRVRSGEVLDGLLHRMLQEERANAILACLTQTTMAAPVRALTAILPFPIVVSEHDQQRDMMVSLTMNENGHAGIKIEKVLALRNTDTMEIIRTIQLHVEASTNEEFAMIGIV